MSGNTAAGRNQLTSPEDRGIMLLADEPAHLENGIRTLPTVQADREYTSPSGCHVKMFFRKEHDPVILKIDAARANEDGVVFYVGNDITWLADRVPPQYITVLKK